MPKHNHTFNGGGYGPVHLADNAAWLYQGGATDYAGGDQPHNHGATGAATVSGTTSGSNTENTGTEGTGTTSASGTGDTGAAGTGATSASSTANTWRPLAQVGIICTKS